MNNPYMTHYGFYLSSINQLNIDMKKLLKSDWLRTVPILCNSVQKCVIPRNHNYKNIQSDLPRNSANQNNQSHATGKWRDLTYLLCMM